MFIAIPVPNYVVVHACAASIILEPNGHKSKGAASRDSLNLKFSLGSALANSEIGVSMAVEFNVHHARIEPVEFYPSGLLVVETRSIVTFVDPLLIFSHAVAETELFDGVIAIAFAKANGNSKVDVANITEASSSLSLSNASLRHEFIEICKSAGGRVHGELNRPTT